MTRRWFSTSFVRGNNTNQSNLNPHSYFYKVLAVPFLKVSAVSLATFYGMKYLWKFLDEDEQKVTERAKTLGNDVRLDVTVVVLQSQHKATLGLDHLGHHIVDQSVLVPDTFGLELRLIVSVVDLLENVLESTVVLLENGVLGGHVQRKLFVQGHLEGRVCKATDTFVSIVHGESDTGSLVVEDLEHLGFVAVCWRVHELETSCSRNHQVSGFVLVSMGVSTNDDWLFPARNQSWDLDSARLVSANDDWLSKDSTTQDVSDDSKVVVLEINVQVRKNQFLLNDVPDDSGHFVSVKLHNGLLDLDFVQGPGGAGEVPGASQNSLERLHWCDRPGVEKKVLHKLNKLEKVANRVVVQPAEILLAVSGSNLLLLQELVLLRLGVDDVLVSDKVGLFWLDSLGSHDNLVSEQRDQKHWNTDVRGNKRLVIEAGNEHVERFGNRDQAAEEQGEPGSVWLQRSVVDKLLSIVTLGLHSSGEVEVGHQDGDPGEQTKDGHHVNEVVEDLGRGRRAHHEGKQTESTCEHQCINRNTVLVSSREESWEHAVGSQSVNVSGCNVEIRIGGREDEDQNTGVDQMRQSTDISVIDGHHEWRGAHVEHKDTVEGQSDSLLDGVSWVSSFTESDTNQFCTEVGENSSHHDGPETSKLCGSLVLDVGVCSKSTWVVPESEANSVVSWRSTEHDTKQQDNKTEHRKNFQRRKPELELTEELDTKVVDDHHHNKKYGNPDSRVDPFRGNPVLHNQRTSNHLIRSDN
ncbi:hypothetical protein OGAPHI_001934 [Ogataea philodendri]|uniref:Uncharacterized protein n=1 Tax=Ogataea philodendri TaxID=1378263 RepID=A0A9P8T7H4_9ASCO|nr:uncharacterized protein OGAPHI_001934 [Ogataea philodendri]KAH3668180.1 hypothetical protein OGAPHI_001934 [Ogataea philodendri]